MGLFKDIFKAAAVATGGALAGIPGAVGGLFGANQLTRSGPGNPDDPRLADTRALAGRINSFKDIPDDVRARLLNKINPGRGDFFEIANLQAVKSEFEQFEGAGNKSRQRLDNITQAKVNRPGQSQTLLTGNTGSLLSGRS